MATMDEYKLKKIELAQQQLDRVQTAWDPPGLARLIPLRIPCA